MNLKFNDLGKQWEEIREGAISDLDSIGHAGSYIGGKDIDLFEKKFSDYIGVEYSVGVSNGTDALKMALRLFNLSELDVVIIPANTYIADYIAAKQLTTSPRIVLVDHDETYCIDTESLNNFMGGNRYKYRKAVVIPVHLYGYACDMTRIMELSQKWEFEVLEDCSQSHGTLWNGQHTGTFGSVAIFSLYPGKNLGAIGDAGIICTNNEEYAKRLKMLRNYGSKLKYYYVDMGYNHRLDTIQAAFLSRKLDRLNDWTEAKRKIAERYLSEIKGVILPIIRDNCKHSFHVFCIQVENRDRFMEEMGKRGIPTLIHYPIPIHMTDVFDKNTDLVWSSKNTDLLKDKIVSIPIHPFLTEEEVSFVIKSINEI